jgi:Kef-type K+ transport system membrane component KefB
LINEFAPVLILLTGALLILGGAKLARSLGLPDALGCGVAVCIIAIGIGLSPADWRIWWAGGSGGDRLLTSVRIVGLTGMLFLAGTRFNSGQSRRKSGLMFGFALTAGVLFTVAVLLMKFLGWLDSGSIVLVAATIVASSLWLPGEFSRFASKDPDLPIDWQAGAVVFTTLALLAVYFYDIFAVIVHTRAASGSVYIVIALYESVKLFVFFGFAYFACSRFLARAEGRISAARTTIGFVLIAVLIFALAAITTNQLGAIAWGFVAGALWRGSEIGRRFRKIERPMGSAMLISFAFLPMLLQSHGRSLVGFPGLIIAVLAAMVLKWFFGWVGMRAGGTSSGNAMRTSAAMVGPGEVAILFLAFGMTRWAIEPSVYFGILGYALVSIVVTPLVRHFADERRAPIDQTRTTNVRIAA